MKKANPFRPNYPISPGMFVGRIEELEKIERQLIQTRAGAPTNFILVGERGIGKSSLLNYIKWAAQGEISIDHNRLNFLVVDVDVDQNTTQLELIQKIELGLRRQLAKSEKSRAYLSDAWSFLTRIEAAGFKINAAENKENAIFFDEFSYSLSETVDRICSETDSINLFGAKYDGILLLIDEADNASADLSLGAFLKLLLERLDRRSSNKFMVGLAGLDNLPMVLSESHPSSLRMFESLRLNRLLDQEVATVVSMCIEDSNKNSSTVTEISAKGLAYLISLSEGYPHFVQQFGYSAFEADTDNLIDESDVAKGAFDEGGALEQIGDRYYRNDFFNRIGKENYRQVLRIMAEQHDSWVTKRFIQKRFKGTATVLANAIKALRDRHIIISKSGEKGVYKLQHKGFALWIKNNTLNPQDLSGSTTAKDE